MTQTATTQDKECGRERLAAFVRAIGYRPLFTRDHYEAIRNELAEPHVNVLDMLAEHVPLD